MTAFLLPWPRAKFFIPGTNYPLAGGKVFSFVAGTTTPLATFTDPSGTTPNTNPVLLDANGEAPIYLGSGLTYKINLQDASGVQIPGYPVDNVPSPDTGLVNLITALADTVNPANGDAMIGVKRTLTGIIATTLHQWIDGTGVSVFEFMTTAQIADVQAGTMTLDVSAAVQAALDCFASKIRFPKGKYRIDTPLLLRRRGVTLEGDGYGSNTGSGITTEWSGAAFYKTTTTTRSVSVVNQAGSTVTINPNAILIIAIESGFGTPYYAYNILVRSLGFFGDSAYIYKPYGIYAYRVPNSCFEDIFAKFCFQGIYGYDCWKTRFVNVWCWAPYNCGIYSENATSNYLENCYVNGAPVSYFLNCTYSQFNNCASDSATDIAYWIYGGQATMVACGEEQTFGLKILCGHSGDATAVVNVNGYYPNYSGVLTRTVAFNPNGAAAGLSVALLAYNYFGYGMLYMQGLRSRPTDEQGASFIENDNVTFIGGSYPGTRGMANEAKDVAYAANWEYHDVLLNDGTNAGGAVKGKAYIGYDGHIKNFIFDIDIVAGWAAQGWLVRDNYAYNYGAGFQDKNNPYANDGQKKIYYTFPGSQFPYNINGFRGFFDFVVYDTGTGIGNPNTSYFIRYNSGTRVFEFCDVATQTVQNPATTVGGANKKLLIFGNLPNVIP